MKRIGLFGGSFNPIHNGHLHLADAARRALFLDQVLLMPAGEAPHKSSSAYAPAKDRLAMCRLAAKQHPWLSVSDYETQRTGKSYTVLTLRHLHKKRPDVRWTLMIGSDMLLTFNQWYRWEEILSIAGLAAVSRNPGDLADLQSKAATLKTVCPQAEITVVQADALPLSSTQIREKLQNGADCSCLLPENVVQYIYRNGLYRGGCIE